MGRGEDVVRKGRMLAECWRGVEVVKRNGWFEIECGGILIEKN